MRQPTPLPPINALSVKFTILPFDNVKTLVKVIRQIGRHCGQGNLNTNMILSEHIMSWSEFLDFMVHRTNYTNRIIVIR